MAFDAGVINGAVTLDDSDFRNKLSGLEGASNDTFKKIAQMAGAYLTLRGAFGFVNSAMAEFSKVEEGVNKLKYAYTEVRASAMQTAKEIQETYNVSATTALNSIANIGDLLTGFGFEQRAALDFAKQITERGIDVASFKGLDQAETIQRMTVALTGNVHALQSMGVVIRQDSEEFKAEYQRILETTNATEQQAKAQAILNEIMKQTKNAENDYLRPDAARTYAQELTDLGQAMQRFRAAAGEQLVAITQPAVVMMREILDVFGKGDDAMKGLIARTAALSAAFIALAKAGAITKIAELPKMLALVGVREKAEADAVVAAENVKRAEYARTEAYRERVSAVHALRLAVAQKEEVAVSRVAAEQNVRNATTAQELAVAKAHLAAETERLVKAELAETTARQTLTRASVVHRTAIMQHTVATQANTAAERTAATAATFAGRAQLTFAAGLRTARAAVLGLYTALGPLGIAMIALSVGYSVVSYMIDKQKESLEEAVEETKEALDVSKEKLSEVKLLNRADAESASRLQDLAKYTRLSSAEQEEAQTIIRKLTERYGDLGISVETATGKLNLTAEALEKIRKIQAEFETKQQEEVVKKSIENTKAEMLRLKDEVSTTGSTIANVIGSIFGFGKSESVYQMWVGDAMKLKDSEAQIRKLEFVRSELEKDGYAKKSKQVGEVIELLKKQAAEEKRLAELQKAMEEGTYTPTVDGDAEEIAKLKVQAEAARRALEAVQTIELKIRMNRADNAGKVAILKEQIQELFMSAASGRFGDVEAFLAGDRMTMDATELDALGRIVEMREQIVNLEKASNDEEKEHLKELAEAQKNFDELIEKRRANRRENRLSRRIDTLVENGDKDAALRIAREELNKAREASVNLRTQYEIQLDNARKSGVIDTDAIREVRSALEKSFSDVDKWQSRIESISKKEEKQERENIRTVGSWSAELLSAQILGTNSAQSQTAKYTKQSAEHLRNIDEEMDSYGAYGA